MGLWAKRTKLRWRWREFRFETTFVVPRIKYGPVPFEFKNQKAAELLHEAVFLMNTEESLAASMTKGGWFTYEGRQYYDSDQLACWLPLLVQLHVRFSIAFIHRKIQTA